MTSPDLFVVCKNCHAEVSPYITECPYCGTRLRKRAPRIERPIDDGSGAAPAKPRRAGRRARTDGGSREGRRRERAGASGRRERAPRLGRMRAGEIPGISADEQRRPYATLALVALSFGVWLSLARYVRADLALAALDGEPWRFLTAALVNEGFAAQFAGVVGLGLFGWLVERRHGPVAVVALFLVCGAGGLAAAVAVQEDALVFGTHGAALGLLCAWLVPTLAARQEGAAGDSDLLGALVIAAVLALVPLLSQGSALAGVFGAALGILAGLLLAAVTRSRA